MVDLLVMLIVMIQSMLNTPASQHGASTDPDSLIVSVTECLSTRSQLLVLLHSELIQLIEEQNTKSCVNTQNIMNDFKETTRRLSGAGQ